MSRTYPASIGKLIVNAVGSFAATGVVCTQAEMDALIEEMGGGGQAFNPPRQQVYYPQPQVQSYAQPRNAI